MCQLHDGLHRGLEPPRVEDVLGLGEKLLQHGEGGTHQGCCLYEYVLHVSVLLRLARQSHSAPQEPPVFCQGYETLVVVAVNVHKGPHLGYGVGLGRAEDHLTEQGGAAAGGHVHKGQLLVCGVTKLGGQSVE